LLQTPDLDGFILDLYKTDTDNAKDPPVKGHYCDDAVAPLFPASLLTVPSHSASGRIPPASTLLSGVGVMSVFENDAETKQT
jgi:hypothetical protein